MMVALRLGSDIITCPNGANGRIVCVYAIDRDVPAGTKPRGVVSWDVQLRATEREI